MNKKSSNNKIFSLKTIVLLIIVFVVSVGVSLAFWILTRTQEEDNMVKSSCLDLSMVSDTDAITLQEQWPINDALGKKLEGYTFTVTNNCDEDLVYSIGLETFDEDGVTELSSTAMKVLIDTNRPKLYSSLETLENVLVSGKTPLLNKELATATIKANDSNTHTLKLWVDNDAPISEQNSQAFAKINIISEYGMEDYNPIRKVITTVDVSKTPGVDNVIATYYEDGELTFSGYGEMADDASEIFINDLLNNDGVGYTEKEKNIVLNDDGYYFYSYGLISKDTSLYFFGNELPSIGLLSKLEDGDEYPEEMVSLIQKTESFYPGITTINIEDGITGYERNSIIYLMSDELHIAGTVKVLKGTTAYFGNLILDEGIEEFQGELFQAVSKVDSELIIPKSVVKLSYGFLTDSPFTSVKLDKNSQITSLRIIGVYDLKKIYISEQVNNILCDRNMKNIDVYFYGPERPIEGFNPSDYKSVTWNYTE